ncbi:MAG: hypothetical protein K9H64_04480 [Bacteroidales bacterium]|nr:hypothetical protein [Bacteroidales bacterium]MCF8455140.1 hypothetical protein [Bacteroidales bacterium]
MNNLHTSNPELGHNQTWQNRKLTFNYCTEKGLLDKKVDELRDMELPFRIELLPIQFPNPNELILNIEEKRNGNLTIE